MSEPNSETPVTNSASSDALDAPLAALLARGAQDTGAPTTIVRLDKLTESEKRILLALLQARMGTPPAPDELSAPDVALPGAGDTEP